MPALSGSTNPRAPVHAETATGTKVVRVHCDSDRTDALRGRNAISLATQCLLREILPIRLALAMNDMVCLRNFVRIF